MSDLEQMQYEHVKALQARVAELEAENRCDVCLGESFKDGRQCMCRGTGKMSVAATYFRERLFKTEQLLSRLETGLERTEKLIREYIDEKK